MSDRDKRLLLILLMVAILGGAFWGAKKISDENATYEAQVTELKNKHSDLVNKNANKNKYVTDTEVNTAAFNKVFADFNTSISQEQTLMFLSTVEKNTGVWLKQQSLDRVTEIYKFGSARSSNPSKAGSIVYQTDNVGITTTTNVSYECSYAQLKTLLTYLRENGKKVTINSMSYSYSASTDMVNGSMSLSLYAIKGSDRPELDVDIKDVFIGTENIFNSSTFLGSAGEKSYKDMIVANYDLYTIVNREGADTDAIICGQSGDVNNQTVISDSTPGIQNVTIKVTGSAGAYNVSYSIGNKMYPAENFEAGAPFICGDSIELLIMSSERGGMTDSTQISLNIINETDIVLNAAVINDDANSPKVIINDTKGAVVFYQ